MSAPETKLVSAADAAGLIADGDHVAIQSMGTQGIPMTLVRELIRQGRRDLTVTSVVAGIGLDWLAWKGCVSAFVGPIVSMERFGLCQGFRRGVQAGAIRFEEYSETGILARLGAGARNLPFGITRGMMGTDLPSMLRDTVREIADPFTGETVLACRALTPDVCILHAHRADPKGNVQYERGTIWPDVQVYPKACGRTIVSVERAIGEDEVRERPHETVIPHFAVDAVVEAPQGCHPTSFFPDYIYDEAFHEAWVGVSRDPERAVETIDRFCAAETQEDYLALIDVEALRATRNWRELA